MSMQYVILRYLEYYGTRVNILHTSLFFKTIGCVWDLFLAVNFVIWVVKTEALMLR